MAMVSTPPSSSVFFTSLTELRMPVEASRTMSIFTSAGRKPCRSFTTRRTPSTTAMVFSPCALMMSMDSARWPFTSAVFSSSCWPSSISAIAPSVTAVVLPPAPRRATIMLRKSCGPVRRARSCTIFSWLGVTMEPAGTSWFSEPSTRTTWSAPIFCASIASRFR